MENNNPFKILLVDDEPDILEFISYNLKKENLNIITANNGKDAIKIAKINKPDLIILDVMMPIKNGFETCLELRKNESLKNTIIVFLSARSEEVSQIQAYNCGANDYITKPIQPKLLIAKIKVLLQYNNKEESNIIIKTKDFIININTYLVTFKNIEYQLPKKEFELLKVLTSNPNQVFNREKLLYEVWGTEVIVGGRTIDVHIRKLREKFGDDKISTIKGIGYKYNE